MFKYNTNYANIRGSHEWAHEGHGLLFNTFAKENQEELLSQVIMSIKMSIKKNFFKYSDDQCTSILVLEVYHYHLNAVYENWEYFLSLQSLCRLT